VLFCVGLVAVRRFYPNASFPLGGIAWMLVFFSGVGIATMSYGFLVLRGKAGGLAILQKGALRPLSATPEGTG
jgi:hypothetical protein